MTNHLLYKHAILALSVITMDVAVSTKAFSQSPSWFTNVTEQIGGESMDTILNYRVYAVDVNNDDYPDLLLEYGNMGLNQLRLFINTADASGANGRKLVETTATSGINPPDQSCDMASVADFNNDGNVDFITNVWVNECNNAALNEVAGLRIFLGDGAGHFTMSTNSGLESIDPEMSGSCLPVLDFDRDGNLDFFCGSQFNYCTGAAGPKFLFKGNGDGTFTDVTASSGTASNNLPLFGSNVADWNNDCHQDILTAPYTTTGYGNLFKNNGDGTFTDLGADANYDPHWMTGDNTQPMVPWEAMPSDYDNDGDVDFLVMEVHGGTGVSEGRSSIFTNQGAPDYALVPEIDRITRELPQASHKGDHKGIWTDFDNDGLVDILMGEGGYAVANERLYFLRQDNAHQFNDITEELGFINGFVVVPEIKGPHAMEPFDFDMDGDDDLVIAFLYNAVADKRFMILQNNVGTDNNWIKIRLQAPAGVNKSCIGARVYVKAGGVTYMRDVYAGQGHFGGQQPFALNFGLGSENVDTIIVRWPDANCSETIVTNNIPVKQIITITSSGISNIHQPVQSKFDINVFPNPTHTNQITVQAIPLFNGRLEIHDVLGRVLYAEHIEHNSDPRIELRTDKLVNGIYNVSLEYLNGHISTKSFSVLR